jgi:hypothetical protein
VADETNPADHDTLVRICDLVAEQKKLPDQLQHHESSESEEHTRLGRVETELDQVEGYLS